MDTAEFRVFGVLDEPFRLVAVKRSAVVCVAANPEKENTSTIFLDNGLRLVVEERYESALHWFVGIERCHRDIPGRNQDRVTLDQFRRKKI